MYQTHGTVFFVLLCHKSACLAPADPGLGQAPGDSGEKLPDLA